MTAGWQDAIAAVVALIAGAWLFQRWLAKRRSKKVGCDTCAASMHARIQKSRSGNTPESSPR
jgi:hypothetical protein